MKEGTYAWLNRNHRKRLRKNKIKISDMSWAKKTPRMVKTGGKTTEWRLQNDYK